MTGTTGVTTLPAPITTTTVPMMATMAPGIAIGILKALLIGSTFNCGFMMSDQFTHFSSNCRDDEEANEELSP